jgi:nucleoid-associated protein YgaU
MLRKDVKLGFVIGGLLLTIVVIYVIFVDGEERPQGAYLEVDEEIEVAQAAPSAPVSEPAVVEPPAAVAQLPQPEVERYETPTAPPVSSPEDAWVLALNHGSVPPMLTATPSPQQASPLSSTSQADATDQAPSAAETPSATETASVDDPSQQEPSGADAMELVNDDTPDPLPPATTPPVAQRTHIVQRGESLAKISEIAYGTQAYWPHILRANPGIVAENIRPGLVLSIPDESEVKVLAADATVARTNTLEQPLDPKTQYKVVSGDTLERISIKLYGKGERWDDIYEVNKEKIGSNPHALRVNMILTLPDAPTQLSTAASN